jgi:hypothetical protein
MKLRGIGSLLVLGAAICLWGSTLTTGAREPDSVKLWEASLTVPTYEIGPPDLDPIFYSGRAYQGAKGPVYPYPILDQLTDHRVNKAYNAVYLEDEFVKICVLPEIAAGFSPPRTKPIGIPFGSWAG